MTTAYFLKMRTSKKACHRTSFQTARVRRLMRRNIAENLLRKRGTHAFRAALPIARRYLHATFAARKKITGSFPPIHFALYHTFLALSTECERMFAIYFFNLKNPCSKALLAKGFSPTEKATRIYFPDLSSLTIFPSPNLACRTISRQWSYRRQDARHWFL